MLINFFLILSLLFLFSGLALDAGMLQLRKLQLQHAADAAALGALYERARGNAGWVAAGKADAALNGFTDGSNGVTISIVSPPASGTYSGNSTAIQATVNQSYHTAFMGLVTGSSTATPGTSSVSANITKPECVYIMGPGSSYFTLINNNYAGFFSACGVYVDSTTYTIYNDAGSTISVTGGNYIQVQAPSVAGSIVAGPTSPTPTWNSPTQKDPLASETAPVFSACDSAKSNTNLYQKNTSLGPGTYCGGLIINASTVNFTPGLYIVTGGITFENGSTITGTGVTFYLTTGGGSGYGNLNIWNSTVTLSAPTSTSGGGITGIVFFGDRNWSNQGNQGVQILSSSVTTNGIWYILNTGIYNYISTLRGTTYLGLVVDNIKGWAATFRVPAPDYSTLTGGSPYAQNFVGGIVQ